MPSLCPPHFLLHSAPLHGGLWYTLWGMALLWNSFSGIFHDERSSTPGAASLEGGLGPSLSDMDPQFTCPALCVELLSASRGRR